MKYKQLFKARLDDETADKLTGLSNKSGLSKSAVLRLMINGASIRETPPLDYQALITQLRKIGVNINQIALAANATGNIDRESYLHSVKELNRVILEIRRTVEL